MSGCVIHPPPPRWIQDGQRVRPTIQDPDDFAHVAEAIYNREYRATYDRRYHGQIVAIGVGQDALVQMFLDTGFFSMVVLPRSACVEAPLVPCHQSPVPCRYRQIKAR